MTPTDIIKVISETAHNSLFASRDTIHEAQVDSEIIHGIVLTAHAHEVYFVLEIDTHFGTMNISALIHTCVTCQFLAVAAHKIHLQISNILHRSSKSRRT